MYRLHFFLLLLLAAYNPRAQAQGSIRLITTNENTARLVKSDPEYANRQSDLEGYIRSYKDENTFAATAPTIPIVFHILYSSDEELIELDQVFKQIEALNRDFGTEENQQRATPMDENGYFKLQSYPGLSFCLPVTDPNGAFTTGILYYKTDQSGWSDDLIKFSKNVGADAWNTKNYLNIWVGNLEKGIAGYAQMPSGPANTDGIVIDYRLFGTNSKQYPAYNEGKTLTHLIGNYLDLYSIWGDGLSECSDDKVWDTPIHNAPNFEILSKYHISLCGSNPVEMFSNFMDCTHDSLRTMFTAGQRQRMYAILDKGGERSALLETPVKCGTQDISDRYYYSWADEGDIQILVFPNPANDLFFIQTSGKGDNELSIDIYDYAGNRIAGRHGHEDNLSFSCSSWPSGLYRFVLSIDGKIIHSQNITILHK